MIRSVYRPKRQAPKQQSIISPIDFRELSNQQDSFLSSIADKRKVLQAWHDEIAAIQKEDLAKHQEVMDAHGQLIADVESKLAYLDEIIAQVQSIEPEKGEQGEPGVDGQSVDHEQVVRDVLSRIPAPKDGIDGVSPVIDHKAIAKEVVKMIVIPKPKNGKDGVAPTIEEIMAYLKDNLKVEHIPGLKNEIDSYRNQLAGKVYGKDTWARGGGDRVKAGSNITVTDNSDGTRTIAAQAGFTLLAPTGTVDGSNTTFVFTRAPSIIVVDGGRAMQKTSSDGTANWTGTTTVVLTIAPSFDIYGF